MSLCAVPNGGGSTLTVVEPDRGRLRWTVHGEQVVYERHWMRIGLADVEAPNGARWEHNVIHLSRVAVALIVNERDEVLMLWRHRFATDEWGYELPGGIVDGSEDPVIAAAREAEEECGWRPVGDPERLASFEPLPGAVTSRIEIFVWRNAQHVGDPADEYEPGIVEWVELGRMTELTLQRQLLGAGTLVAVLLYLATAGTGTR